MYAESRVHQDVVWCCSAWCGHVSKYQLRALCILCIIGPSCGGGLCFGGICFLGYLRMFAVVEEGSKQYLVRTNDVIAVERIGAAVGSVIILSDVVHCASQCGEGRSADGDVKVTAEVLEHILGDKVIVFKKKRRHNYRRKRGHRQNLTVLRIRDVV